MIDFATCICLMFACVSANHLGLISKIESIIKHPIPIVNCSMCSSFWSTLIYMLVSANDIIGAVAMSFFFAYLALWTELTMCVADYYYKKIYGKIIKRPAPDKTATGTSHGNANGPLF